MFSKSCQTAASSAVSCQYLRYTVWIWLMPTRIACRLCNRMQISMRSPSQRTKLASCCHRNSLNRWAPPPGLDKRSSKADQFSITYKPSSDSSHPEMYTICANLSDDLQVSLDVSQPSAVPGFKVSKGPKGGKPDGYVVHSSGHIIHNSKAIIAEGHGMHPNLIASCWNFANFQSDAYGGMSAIQMEFITLDTHRHCGAGSGPATVNVGSLVLDGKLAVVTAETKWSDEAQPEKAVMSHTGYMQPTAVEFRWAGSPLLQGVEGPVVASLHLDVGSPSSPMGLIEKVDVLAEIPYVIKTMVNYVAGMKPYIYQWQNNVKLAVRGPDALIPGLSKGLDIEGVIYTEASFIS
ncbi:Svf1-like-domain-containing protein [Suillus ampliporus]|nr:Svf1-like-domain-containing protein [Suillus ampliporus]